MAGRRDFSIVLLCFRSEMGMRAVRFLCALSLISSLDSIRQLFARSWRWPELHAIDEPRWTELVQGGPDACPSSGVNWATTLLTLHLYLHRNHGTPVTKPGTRHVHGRACEASVDSFLFSAFFHLRLSVFNTIASDSALAPGPGLATVTSQAPSR